MNWWSVVITALQPISIARRPERDNHWDTASYIPGSTWRGAVAEQWKYIAGFSHQLTDSFFVKGIWRDAHPGKRVVTSLDVVKCKKCHCKKSILHDYIKKGITGDLVYCNSCGVNMIRDESGYGEQIVRIEESTGIQISATREATSHGQLYTLSCITEGTCFLTTAYLPESAIENVAEKVGEGKYRLIAHLGKKRSVGYGKVEIIFNKNETKYEHQYKKMEDKIDRYSKALEATNGDCYVSLVAQSPLILLDRFLRPVSEIDWPLHIGNEVPMGKKVVSWGTSSLRHGWNSAWETFKPVDWVINTGSVHVYHFNGLSKSEKEILIKKLLHIQDYGLGERTNEGFGNMEICPQIFEQTDESIKTIDETDLMEKENDELISTAESFAGIIYKHIKKSQIYSLKQLDDSIVLQEITEEDPRRYIQSRLDRKIKRGWREKVEWNGKNECIGGHLREIVRVWKPKEVKRFLDYVLGYYVIESEKIENREGK